MKQWLLIGALAFMVGLPAAQANVYNFNYTGNGVTASGQLSTTMSGFLEVVTGISGQRNGIAITGVVPTSTLGVVESNDGFQWDNVLVSTSLPYFNNSGLLFSTTISGPLPHDGFNIYVDTALAEYSYHEGGGVIDFQLSAAPEPGFYGVLALGLGGLFVGVRRRRSA